MRGAGGVSLSQRAVSQNNLTAAVGGGGGEAGGSSAAQTFTRNVTSPKSKRAEVGFALEGLVSAPDG